MTRTTNTPETDQSPAPSDHPPSHGGGMCHDADLALFMLVPDPHAGIRTETPVERRFMAADLFLFRRARGDFTLSLLMVGLVGVLVLFFPTETGWSARKLPPDLPVYLATQFGMLDPEGRIMRLGKILKQPVSVVDLANRPASSGVIGLRA